MKDPADKYLKKPLGTGKQLWFLIGLPVIVVLLLVAFWLLFEHTRKPSFETTLWQPDLPVNHVIHTNNKAPNGHPFTESAEQTT
jgi:hypothetical protein